jgi:hypothetical protein
METPAEFLAPDCYLHLVQICLDKCVVHRLNILKTAASGSKRVKLDILPSPESITLEQEVEALQHTFDELLLLNDASHRSLTGCSVDVSAALEPLQLAVSLISSPLHSERYNAALVRVLEHGKAAPLLASVTVGSSAESVGNNNRNNPGRSSIPDDPSALYASEAKPTASCWQDFLKCCLALRIDAGGCGVTYGAPQKRGSESTDRLSNMFSSLAEWGRGSA